jgi:hypothetical protein
MERLPHGKYTKELRLEAVRLVTEGGLSVQEASMPPGSRLCGRSPSTSRCSTIDSAYTRNILNTEDNGCD